MTGQIALITGAADGIGRATALAFAAAGARLVITDIAEEPLEGLAEEIRRNGGEVLALRADATSPEDCEQMVRKAVERFGRLDAAHNNVGVGDFNPDEPVGAKSVESWRRTIELTLSSVFYCLRAELPVMEAQGSGAIVNTASIAGLIAFPHTAGYVSAKHGVIGLTKVVALEYASKGIRCNAVAPGHTLTTQMQRALDSAAGALDPIMAAIPAGRLAKPAEIADAVVWLCSSAAAYINGACLPVDGGYVVP